jgi:hypothetical protein
LEQRYGDAVRTSFHDFAIAAERERNPEMAGKVQANRWSLPLVSIDGKIEFSGYIDHRAIVKSVESLRQNRAERGRPDERPAERR